MIERSQGGARVVRLGELDAISVAGGRFLPLRRSLGVRAFGLNAFTAVSVGDQLVERHDEAGAGSGHQEEAYIVVSGRALFTVDGEVIDADVGTVIFVPDVGSVRSAVAEEPGTTVMVVGGPADRPLPTSPFEHWFVAQAPYARGDYAAAIEIVSEGLEEWPDHPVMHYQLACYHALAGNNDDAIAHLARAIAADPEVKGWASSDSDLDELRADRRFIAAIQ